MNLEEVNKSLTKCLYLDRDLNQEDNTSRWTVHHEMVESVREYQSYWGLSSDESILKQLMRTRSFCRTVLPN